MYTLGLEPIYVGLFNQQRNKMCVFLIADKISGCLFFNKRN